MGSKTKPRGKAKRRKQDLHFLNGDGMVACNPRDREAAHRAVTEGIATVNSKAVTCKKCWAVIPTGGSSSPKDGKLRPKIR